MSKSVPALIKASLLVWAREKAGLSIERSAIKAHISIETLRAWEAGKERPSISQLRRLGEIYKRPLAIFFLSEPPLNFDAQREFRRLPGITPKNESPALRLALRMSLFRREAAREIHERLGDAISRNRIAVKPSDDEDVVSKRIRDLLNISWSKQVSWGGPYTALDAWRNAIEDQGVLVFQTGKIKLNEMRGISVPDGPIPVILLNNADMPHGRIFTLLHEFIHILLTEGGYHTSKLEGEKLPEDQLLERISNRFAAAVLMPKKEFLEEAKNYPLIEMGSENELKQFANKIKLSPEAILRRLLTLHCIPISIYRQKRKMWQQYSWGSLPKSRGGPPVEIKVISSMGRTFTKLILEGYKQKVVSGSDVADYLGIQLKYLQRVSDQLFVRPGLGAS